MKKFVSEEKVISWHLHKIINNFNCNHSEQFLICNLTLREPEWDGN